MESVLQCLVSPGTNIPGFANEFDNKAMSYVDGGMQHMMFPDRLTLLTVTHASANRSQCRYNHPTEVSRSAATDLKSRDFTL